MSADATADTPSHATTSTKIMQLLKQIRLDELLLMIINCIIVSIEGTSVEENIKMLVAGPGARKAPLAVLSSKKLFGGDQQPVIDHGGDFYRLGVTRQGKLILTK